jgi:hypothetical protein
MVDAKSVTGKHRDDSKYMVLHTNLSNHGVNPISSPARLKKPNSQRIIEPGEARWAS